MAVVREALDKLFELIGGDPGSLAELIESFLDESPMLVGQMQRAADAGDQTSLGRAAHTLKSSARDFGASQLSVLCEALEKLCREGMPEHAAVHVNAIAAECTLAQQDLTVHLTELKRGDWSK
jgi:HPt (histidine-containing phosphotransfer) domain-containing protein